MLLHLWYFIDLFFFTDEVSTVFLHWLFAFIFVLQGKFYLSFLLLVSLVIRSGHALNKARFYFQR